MVVARRAGEPDPGLARGKRVACAQGRRRSPLAAWGTAACRRRINRRLIPTPLLFMLRSRGSLRACAAHPFGTRPLRAQASCGGPAPSPLARTRVPVAHAQAWGRAGGVLGRACGLVERRACARERVGTRDPPPQHFINIKKVGHVPSFIQNTYGHYLI